MQLKKLGLIALSALALNAQASPPSGYKLSFDEEFTGPLDVAPGTGWGDGITNHKWYCHTPYSGDFGDAWFSGPQDSADGKSPFSLSNGILSITSWVDSTTNHWRSGLLSSVNWAGQGFAQVDGYYEARMKMPSGGGVWPCFWLCGIPGIFRANNGNALATIEIDAFEYYGNWPTLPHCNVHLWNSPNSGGPGDTGTTVTTVDLSKAFHVYGVLVTPSYITFSIDGKQAYQVPSTSESYEPLYIMVDLALGGGNGSDPAPNTQPTLQVDYIRAYSAPQ